MIFQSFFCVSILEVSFILSIFILQVICSSVLWSKYISLYFILSLQWSFVRQCNTLPPFLLLFPLYSSRRSLTLKRGLPSCRLLFWSKNGVERWHSDSSIFFACFLTLDVSNKIWSCFVSSFAHHCLLLLYDLSSFLTNKSSVGMISSKFHSF